MQTIKLDVSNIGNVRPVYVKQKDVRAYFVIELYENGKPYSVDEENTFSVWYSGPSGEGNYSKIQEEQACVAERNQIKVQMIAQMLLKPGEHEMCVVMFGQGNEQKGFWNVPYVVQEIPGADSEVAEQYFSELSGAAEAAKKAAETARLSAIDAAESASQAEAIANPVKYIQQDLTEEQKAQARENIGAAAAELPKEKTYYPTENGYIKVSDGAINTNIAGTYNTGFISVFGYSRISASYRLVNVGYAIAFYDGDKTLLAESSVAGADGNKQNLIEVDIPQDAVYCIFSSYTGENNEHPAYITLKTKQQTTYIPSIVGYVHSTGVISTNDWGSYRTDYISLEGYKKIFVSYRLLESCYVIAFFDGTKTLIKDISILGEGVKTQHHFTVDVPSEAAFCIFSAYLKENLTGEGYITLYTQEDIDKIKSSLHMKTINALGDSITSVDYTTPTWWQIIEDRTGGLFNNYGKSGTSIAVREGRTDSFVERVANLDANADGVIVMGGTNDNGIPKGTWSSTDTTTFFGALNVLFSTLCENFAGKPIFVCTPIQTAENVNYITGNPTSALAGTAETAALSLQLRVEAIKQKSAQYGLPCIDLFYGSGINGLDANRVYYRPDDTLHPSSVGQNRLANLIQSELEKFFA